MLSSAAHTMAPKGGIEFDNLSGERGYSAWRAYGQSKFANLLFAKELARRFAGTARTANALHPGVIFDTNLSRSMNVPRFLFDARRQPVEPSRAEVNPAGRRDRMLCRHQSVARSRLRPVFRRLQHRQATRRRRRSCARPAALGRVRKDRRSCVTPRPSGPRGPRFASAPERHDLGDDRDARSRPGRMAPRSSPAGALSLASRSGVDAARRQRCLQHLRLAAAADEGDVVDVERERRRQRRLVAAALRGDHHVALARLVDRQRIAFDAPVGLREARLLLGRRADGDGKAAPRARSATATATGLEPQTITCGRGSTGSMKMSMVPWLGHMFLAKRTPPSSSPACNALLLRARRAAAPRPGATGRRRAPPWRP